MAGDDDALITIVRRHPLVGFTRPVTSMECGDIETCHHFEVPKKGQAKKPIIFHALGRGQPCQETRR